jgi:hypothetical protein
MKKKAQQRGNGLIDLISLNPMKLSLVDFGDGQIALRYLHSSTPI